jgi:hypothetical protein
MISHSPQQPDPSILVQYQNVGSNRDDRRLMSTPFPNPQQRYLMRQQQHQQHQVQDMFTEIGPYGCGIMGCFASFSISSGLFTHIKEVHKNIGETYKPYRCAMPTCPKRYKNINGLQYHLREAKGSSGHGHVVSEETSNVRPYHCQIPGCKKAYRTANGLRYHNQNGHLTGPPLQQMVNAAMQEQQHQLRMQHASPHLLQSIHQQVQTQQAHGHVETRAQATHAQQQQSHQSLPHFIGHPR